MVDMDKLDISQLQAFLVKDSSVATINILLSLVSFWLVYSTLAYIPSRVIQHIRKRTSAWSYLLNGPRLIREGYERVCLPRHLGQPLH
jgi:hypothetical protein